MQTYAFEFRLGVRVVIMRSREAGEVIGCAVYKESNVNQYLVRYLAADGRASEAWWAATELTIDIDSAFHPSELDRIERVDGGRGDPA